MIETARKLQEQADALLAAAGVEPSEETDEPAVSDGAQGTDTADQPLPGEEAEETAEPEPVIGLPEDDESEEAKIDPPEVMDMRDELVKVRDLLARKGFHRRESSSAGEVWERSGPRGEPGFRATLVSTPHGRIRMEVRDPSGFIKTQAEPATEVDCEIALAGVV